MRIKKSPIANHVSAPLESVSRRLARWRKTRKHRSPIPEALWCAAARAARKYGLHRTARTLRLDYYSLKKRFDAAGIDGSVGQELKPAFVELIPPIANFPECTVELEHPRGRKMRICLKGAAAPDLATLSRTFWSIKK